MRHGTHIALLASSAALVTGCQHVARQAAPPAAQVREVPPAVFSMAEGTWDVARGDSTCLGNTHAIGFAADRRQMTLTFRDPIDTVSGKRVARYDILQAGGNVLPGVPWVVRAAMEGENRRAPNGELVVWDLILATPNRYHWRRTDWRHGATTGAFIRCRGTLPLEQWRPPGPTGSGTRIDGT